jgi:tryptophanyl-tRNA synthetase
VRLQNLGVELLVVVADYQTITDRDSPASLPGDVEELLADYLAVGIDPDRAVIFAHSQVTALNQLLVAFLSLVSVPELARNPTVRQEQMSSGLTTTSGLMFTYPVHQAADILFGKATVVPVGQDQLPHLELTRSIARRFNRRYSPDEPFFPQPQALLSDAPSLLGTDGQKMSKSRCNAIALGEGADETARLIRCTRTDAERLITYEPARRPEVSNLVLLAGLCQGRSPQDIAAEVGDQGSAALKRLVTDAINDRFAPVRAARAELIRDRGYLRQVLRSGTDAATELAEATLTGVRALMHTTY